jgi:hypothetical protein
MRYIFKDYRLEEGILSKTNINESKHLLWREGGVPCLDSNLWDTFNSKIQTIVIKTNKGRTFQVSADVFHQNKRNMNLGFGRQYYIPKNLWKITEPTLPPITPPLTQAHLL